MPSATTHDPPVLYLLPGLLCDRAVWAPVIARLGSTVQCRIPDYSAERSLPAMAERVLARAPERFAVAGHSMGARVALEILRLAPARVTRVALLDTGYAARSGGDAGETERAQRLALLALARERGMRAMGEAWMRPMVHPARLTDAALVETILAMIERQSPERFAGQIEALLDRPDATDLMRTVRVPALVACGREDAWSPPAQHEAMAAAIPASHLAIFNDCGHMAPMEQPDAVAQALAAWLVAGPSDPSEAPSRASGPAVPHGAVTPQTNPVHFVP
ncbi:MAG: alpha/beta fold hydrolase [Burkholderiales bacterium]|nr:alpha/beta fold hydrolase [Burkholderiales bacterium]